MRREKRKKSGSGKQKGEESDSSDSGDKPVLDDDWRFVEYVNELCPKCQCETKSNVRVQCAVCNSYWHVECVNEINLSGKSQEANEAMDVEFYCIV